MTPAPVEPAVSKNVLDQIDVRVGTIQSVADVPDANKLVALRVTFGDHERTIVAGIKNERADVQELVGRQALFVVNLEPRKGMLFDLGFADGIKPALSVPEVAVPDGTRAG